MISVIVPTRNRPEALDAALRSVASQTFTDLELIVVNDGGTSVRRVVDRWRAQVDITAIELRERHGAAHARNVGVDHARGSYIAFLDDDDVFFSNHLAAAAHALASGELDLVYSGAVVSRVRIDELPDAADVGHRKAYAFSDRLLLVANFIHTGAVVVRNFASTTARFDESLSHCEDWDLWLSLRFELGFSMGFVNRLTTAYHQIADTTSLLSEGQATVPSPFASARRRVYARWPSWSSQVLTSRAWLTEVDDACDEHVLNGGTVPVELFDRALNVLDSSTRSHSAPDLSLIPSFFEQRSSALGVFPEESHA